MLSGLTFQAIKTFSFSRIVVIESNILIVNEIWLLSDQRIAVSFCASEPASVDGKYYCYPEKRNQ